MRRRLAAGYAQVALGSDTEGSLRGPVEFAGVVGMRPSRGRHSDEGIVPCNIAHDTAGPMGRTAADVAALDAVLTGGVISDYAPSDLSTLKVAMPADWAALATADGSQKALALAKAALVAGGATVLSEGDELSFGPLVAPPEGFAEPSFRQEGLEKYLSSHEGLKGKSVAEVLQSSFYPNIATFFLEPKATPSQPMINMSNQSPDQYAALKATYDAQCTAWEAKYTSYFDAHAIDVILTPCCATEPAPARTPEEYDDPASFVPLIIESLKVYKPVGHGLNGLPIPSIALPTPATHSAPSLGGPPMPAGVLLWGRPNGDKKLIEVAMALEKAMKQ